MKRTSAIAVSAIFAISAPGTVAGIVPWWISRWKMQAPFLHFYGFRVIGILFILASLPVLLDSFARFALQGLGTPAPASPRAIWWSRACIVMFATRCTLQSSA